MTKAATCRSPGPPQDQDQDQGACLTLPRVAISLSTWNPAGYVTLKLISSGQVDFEERPVVHRAAIPSCPVSTRQLRREAPGRAGGTSGTGRRRVVSLVPGRGGEPGGCSAGGARGGRTRPQAAAHLRRGEAAGGEPVGGSERGGRGARAGGGSAGSARGVRTRQGHPAIIITKLRPS